jgi:hypothetical protein
LLVEVKSCTNLFLSLKTGEISSDYGQSGDNPLCCLTMSDLNQRQDAIVEEFSGLNGWEGKYKRIIDLGKQLEALDDSLKSENLKVKGCQSQFGCMRASLMIRKWYFKQIVML